MHESSQKALNQSADARMPNNVAFALDQPRETNMQKYAITLSTGLQINGSLHT